MAIISRGYGPDESANKDLEADWQLFSQNIDLILKHEQDILACRDYFFCSPSFACCSWPYVGGDGQLFLGYLISGWQNRLLVQPCPDSGCGGTVLITSFAGSPLSGSNHWSGYCADCQSRKSGSRTDIRFYELVDFVSKLRQTFPASVQEIETYDGCQFCWGGSGLEQVKKNRVIWKPVAEPINLSAMIEELKSNNIRQGKPVNVLRLKRQCELKLSSSLKKDTVHFKL